MKWYLFAVIGVCLATGCEKPVDFDLEQAPSRLVVDAVIETGEPPRVVLSKSLDYFSKISSRLLVESFVHNAEVYVSTGTLTHRLKEYEVPLGGGFALYYYSADTSSPQTAFLGEVNSSYSLKIIAGGEEYTAQTTIPAFSKQIDSLWWKPMPRDSSEGKVVVLVRATDPPGYGHYSRYWTRRNNEPFWPGVASVYDDLVIDGTTYELEVEPGINRNDAQDEDERAFRRGDSVTLKLASIDRVTYDFWRTMEYNYASVGNPFSTPIRVLGNVSNGALGYFGGYASQYKTLVIPQ